MNANAPEKIYIGVVPSDLGNNKYTTVGKDFPDAEEYARADAFIEKMARFLENRLYDRVEIRGFGTVIPSLTSKKEFIEEFKNYMKEG